MNSTSGPSCKSHKNTKISRNDQELNLLAVKIWRTSLKKPFHGVLADENAEKNEEKSR